MENVQHTGLPWRGGKYSSNVGCPIVGPTGENVCKTLIPMPTGFPGLEDAVAEAEENAAFIIRACNAHDELVDMLSRLAGYAQAGPNQFQECRGILDISAFRQLVPEALAILAKAGGR